MTSAEDVSPVNEGKEKWKLQAWGLLARIERVAAKNSKTREEV